ncbi:MAG: methionyl-tRNA formyltransferase [bacterium]
MKILFMGTDRFAVPSLLALVQAGHTVPAAVTQPDRPRGRGQKLLPTPLKEAALSLGIQVLSPLKLKDGDFLEKLKELSPDLIVVSAYARLIPGTILNLPPLGCINVHPSLLPRFRGATPIESAILAGEKETGISIFLMDEGYDTGDLILKKSFPIGEVETGGELRERLAGASAPLLLSAVRMLEEAKAVRTPQDRSAGEYTRPFKKEDEKIIWTEPAEKIFNRIRALNPRPGACTSFKGKNLKVLRSRIGSSERMDAPGEIISLVRGEGPEIACGRSSIILLEVQPEGKKPMLGWDFTVGHRPVIGDKFI